MERSSESLTDKELLEAFVGGDEESFNALVQRHKMKLFNVAYRVLYDRQAAEDVVQRVFIRLAERTDELAKVRSVQAWLYAATLNLSLDVQKTMRRRKQREKVAGDSSRPESPREVAMRSELRKELDLALAGLKNSLRIPLILRYSQGLSYEETGEAMGLSSEAVRKRVKRGLRALRTLLKTRNLALPVAGIRAMLRAAPSEAASAHFLTSASSIIKAAAAGGAAAKAAVTTTAVVKGGLMMSAKVKIAIGISAAVLLGTVGYLATRKGETERNVPRLEERVPMARGDIGREEGDRGEETPGGGVEPSEDVTRPKDALWGRVVDVEGNAVTEATVEAGVFEGDTVTSLVRKTLVRATTTDDNGLFVFGDKAHLSRVSRVVRKRAALPQKLPGALHGLLVATKEGCFPTTQEADFHSLDQPHDIILKKAPGIGGRVVWKENQKPIARVKVACEVEKSDLYRLGRVEGQTDAAGRFRLTVAAEGAARVWPDFGALERGVAGRKPKEPNVRLVPGEDVENMVLEVELLSDTILEGRIINEENEGVGGAEVRLCTDKGVGEPVTSEKDGWYRLMVRRSWPYQSYFIGDWPGMPKFRASPGGLKAQVRPKEQSLRTLPDGKWDWAEYWSPPTKAPPERLIAIHPKYAIGIAEVPWLGIGQIRENVDIVLFRGSRVSGKVMDDSGEPLKGAQIRIELVENTSPALIKNDNEYIQQKKVTSGEDGNFEICFVEEGSYEVTASYERCPRVTQRLELGPHQGVEGFDFVLLRGRGFIRGKVMDQDGNPWPHGTVKASDYHCFLPIYCAEIGQDGRYELTNMDTRRQYCLYVQVSDDYPEPEGFLWATFLAYVPTGTDGADITVTVLPAGSLRIRVTDDSGKPVERFEALCCPLGFPNGRNGIATGPAKWDQGQNRTFDRDGTYSGVLCLRRDVTSDSGEFVADRVAGGRYFVSLKAEGYGEEFREVEVYGGRESEAAFELKALGRLEGLVLDGEGRPIEGVWVTAVRARHFYSTPDQAWILGDTSGLGGLWMPRSPQAQSRSDGRFVLERLQPGEHKIMAVREWKQTVFADVTVGREEQEFVEIVFPGGSGSIEGWVFGDDGKPIFSQDIAVIGDACTIRGLIQHGQYAFRDLAPGRYMVRANLWGKHYGREVNLGDGEHVQVDIVAQGQGGIEGTLLLAGEAGRAAAWLRGGEHYLKLVLTEVEDSEGGGRRELHLPFGAGSGTFELENVPAGSYEARAYFVVTINPLGASNLSHLAFANQSQYRAQFVSEPQIVRVQTGSKAAVSQTISRACAPHHPVPDEDTCEGWLPIDWRHVGYDHFKY